MKHFLYILLLSLPVLAFSQARYDIVQMPLCWTVGGGDSSITRYVLVSSTGAYSTVMYLNASGAQVNYTGGILRNGHCDCCTGGGGGGSGTVTSVATGYGLSGGPITTTGTIAADTAALATKTWTSTRGYITAEVDGSITNEGRLNTRTISSTAQIQTNTSGSDPISITPLVNTGQTISASTSTNGGLLVFGNDTSIIATRAHVLDQTKLKFETATQGVRLRNNATNSVTIEPGPGLFFLAPDSTRMVAFVEETMVVACSDETSNLTTGNAKVTFRAPFKMMIQDVRLNVNTAPTGSTILVDINNSGGTIFTTRPSIDANEKTSTTAATPYVLGVPLVLDDQELTIDIDQVGSTIAGKGLKVHITYLRIP